MKWQLYYGVDSTLKAIQTAINIFQAIVAFHCSSDSKKENSIEVASSQKVADISLLVSLDHNISVAYYYSV
uniref:Uncharacterized protein n=1 Tax=Anguilla anguilla TaxID=7936 RepID=A0A0E9XKA7_ANGAN